VTLYDVLRAVVLGDAAQLNDSGWQAEALAAIDAAEPAAAPEPAPVVAAPGVEGT
jgi:hypothetical protein